MPPVNVIIFIVTLFVFIPLAGSLLYVWWKYEKKEKGVAIARVIFLLGAAFLFGYMLII